MYRRCKNGPFWLFRIAHDIANALGTICESLGPVLQFVVHLLGNSNLWPSRELLADSPVTFAK